MRPDVEDYKLHFQGPFFYYLITSSNENNPTVKKPSGCNMCTKEKLYMVVIR